jgi:hypothetical protein
MEDIMEKTMRFAAITEFSLILADAAFQHAFKYLPLGGSHIAQIAIVFGSAFAIVELISILRNK